MGGVEKCNRFSFFSYIISYCMLFCIVVEEGNRFHTNEYRALFKHLWIRCSGWMYICAIISSLRFKNAVRIITSRPNTGTACSIFTIELSFGGRFLRFILVGHCRI